MTCRYRPSVQSIVLTLLLLMESSCTSDPVDVPKSPLANLTVDLLQAMERVGEEQASARKQIEAARVKSLEQFRKDDSKFDTGWESVQAQRKLVEAAMQNPVNSWNLQLESMIGDRKTEPAILYPECLRVLEVWTSGVSPETVRQALRSRLGGIVKVLSARDDAESRRPFLNRLATRYLAVPGVDDVDALCAIVDWSSMFHVAKTVGSKQLSAVTEDLILLFTDRGPSGIALSGAGYYVPGRFTSRGFKLALRDDSDQVRHLAWALRILANSPFPKQAEGILRLKEVRDSQVRDLPMNEADLALNRIARQWVESVRAEPLVPCDAFALRLRRALGQ